MQLFFLLCSTGIFWCRGKCPQFCPRCRSAFPHQRSIGTCQKLGWMCCIPFKTAKKNAKALLHSFCLHARRDWKAVECVLAVLLRMKFFKSFPGSLAPSYFKESRRINRRGFVAAFHNHDFSGTASQVIPQGRRQHTNAFGRKVGFELATEASSSMSLRTRPGIPTRYLRMESYPLHHRAISLCSEKEFQTWYLCVAPSGPKNVAAIHERKFIQISDIKHQRTNTAEI